MKRKPFYYSALDKRDTAVDHEPVQLFEFGGNIAMAHSIESCTLPPAYARCDVLYTEPPWEHGYDIFNNNAHEKGTSYKEFMEKINIIVRNENKPTVIIIGKKYVKLLDTPAGLISVELNGYPALALFYNMQPVNAETNIELIEKLSQAFDCVGDFCCGYGNTGRIFFENRKSFVMSDVNPRCIGFIKNYYENLPTE